MDPYGAGYNIIQSLLAFAAGGFWGVGYGNSKQKLAWLPEGHTDFIFAVIAEELGFLGCFLVIGLFWTFIHRGIIISSRANDMVRQASCRRHHAFYRPSGFYQHERIKLPYTGNRGSAAFHQLRRYIFDCFFVHGRGVTQYFQKENKKDKKL